VTGVLARPPSTLFKHCPPELIEQGIEAQKQKEKAFFQLAERFRAASDPEQVKNLGEPLGHFVFGE
jgi:hypothetical protein